MRIRIELFNGAGDFVGHQTIDVNDDRVDISEAIMAALRTWVLAPGDLIQIEELKS